MINWSQGRIALNEPSKCKQKGEFNLPSGQHCWKEEFLSPLL